MTGFLVSLTGLELLERIHDLKAVEVAGVLHVFGEKDGAAGLFG